MKRIVKYIIILLVASLAVSCSKKENTVLDEHYHLNILYGDIENYTGNDGQWLNLYQAESNKPTPV